MKQPTGSATRGHRLFAATYDVLTRGGERRFLAPIRRRIVGPAAGRVLEVGVGTGANLPYYDWDRIETFIATEPDPFMLERARRRAHALGLPIEFQPSPAEHLPFPAASFDMVVATLVLCSVDDQARALAEIRRVLSPDGTFRFVEHVRAPGGFAAWMQDALTPLWSRVGAGCHLNRPTAAAIEAAGFEIVDVETHLMPFTTLHAMIAGVARLRRRPDSHRADGC